MTVASAYASAAWAVLVRDARVFKSYRLRMVTQLLTMLFTLTMFFYVAKLVRPDAVGAPGKYYAFVVVGICAMSILTSALSLGDLIRMELVAGTFERVVISPLGPVGGAISLALFPILYATFFAAVMLLLAVGFYGVPVDPAGILLALPIGILAAAAFGAIGLLFVSGLLAYKSAMGVTWVITGLGLVGGVYFPTTLFPGWISWVVEIQPFTPALDLLRHVLVGTPSLQAPWIEVVKLVAFTAVLMPGSAAVLWQAVKISRRRGTLMEY
jgi:ABC-2 type transport system permease protein